MMSTCCMAGDDVHVLHGWGWDLAPCQEARPEGESENENHRQRRTPTHLCCTRMGSVQYACFGPWTGPWGTFSLFTMSKAAVAQLHSRDALCTVAVAIHSACPAANVFHAPVAALLFIPQLQVLAQVMRLSLQCFTCYTLH